MVPDMASASREASTGWKGTGALAFCSTFDKAALCQFEHAERAFDSNAFSLESHVHTLGNVDGCFANETFSFPQCPASGDVTQNFTTDTAARAFAVGHDTLGWSRWPHPGHHDLRNGIAAFVNTQARTGDALNALNHGTTSVILHAISSPTCHRQFWI